MFLNKGNFDLYFIAWANGFVESAQEWRPAMVAGLTEDEPKGEPFLAKVGAGLAAVTPFIAEAAQVLGEAFVEGMADDIRGKGKPAQRNRSQSMRYQQRSGQYRRRSSNNGRPQRRGK